MHSTQSSALANTPAHASCVDRHVEKVHPAADIHVLPSVTLSGSDTSISAKKAVVVAADGPAAKQMIDPSLWTASPSKDTQGVGTCCLYFRQGDRHILYTRHSFISALKAPMNGENVLYLNGDGDGIVNNCCFPSTVSSSYAPPGEVIHHTFHIPLVSVDVGVCVDGWDVSRDDGRHAREPSSKANGNLVWSV